MFVRPANDCVNNIGTRNVLCSICSRSAGATYVYYPGYLESGRLYSYTGRQVVASMVDYSIASQT